MLLLGHQRDKLYRFIKSFYVSAIGRGPGNLKIVCNSDWVIAMASGVLTTIEKSYIKCGANTDLIHQLHDAIIQKAYEQFRLFFAQEFGLALTRIVVKTDSFLDEQILHFEVRPMNGSGRKE